MQDWISDDPKSDIKALKTATQLYAEEFVTCQTCEQQPWFSFFFDGTLNSILADEAPINKMSNVARLFKGHLFKPPLIFPFYYPGVGTPLDASSSSWLNKMRDSEKLGGGAGLGGDARLKKAEENFSERLRYNHKVTRIDIAVFGFSRGATLARAFVNRLLKKCEKKEGVPYWPCDTALDGKSAPLHIRFLGIFDTVESVGLPGVNLNMSMEVRVPKLVERCVHIVSGHELRAYFPLTPVRDEEASFEELVYPGVHADVGGGYRPNEQARSDQLPRIALNQMRLKAAIAGVPFIAPSLADKDQFSLFEYDQELKTAFDEYMNIVGTAGTLEQQTFAHVRQYYGWLKIRYKQDQCGVYQGVCSSDPEINAQLQAIQRQHGRIPRDLQFLEEREFQATLKRTDDYQYRERKRDFPQPAMTALEEAYLDAWRNPPTLSDSMLKFFDNYVHDSRASFMDIGNGGYLMPRKLITRAGKPSSFNPPRNEVPLVLRLRERAI